MRVLLLGASGFLGRQVRLLLEGDPRVGQLVCAGRARLDLLRADVASVAGLLASVRPGVVINCTGRMSGGPDELLRGNAGVVAMLVEAMAEVTPSARLVRLGSAAEYGPVPYGSSTREDDPARPVTAYGVSHLAGTGLITSAPVDGVSLRVFNPVGPGLTRVNVMGKAHALLGEAEGSITLGPLGAVRDFVDVRDVARAVVAAAFAGPLPERVFNVGSGRAVTVRQAVEQLARTVGFTGEIREREDPRAVTGEDRSGAATWSQADISRAEKVLGWRPVHGLADSLKAMAEQG
ncbi:NAD-dependent epimerase/dehydratase family protein [Nonomuraea dietziae]|uniref:Nucleoside-diphosphate-sugar epimerase n=1 Tax=Nonomuraea dietziae TaxID=65515 RepID=A0A7W5VEI7_9ACTN|nr:NAD-dependent epimerase/dehydratase family protein [Nonomuraea dietziae]MBB3726287.1 nucleoside-diphosphate-sugar epimerase [Nonomuraea dietziae]